MQSEHPEQSAEQQRMTRREAIAWTVAAAGVAGVAMPAFAQPRRGRGQDPQPAPGSSPPGSTQPGGPAGPATPGQPAQGADPLVLGANPSPFVSRTRERQNTLVTDLTVRSFQEVSARPTATPAIDRWRFQTLSVVLPIVGAANADVRELGDGSPRAEGLLRVDGIDLTREFRVLDGFQGGTRLASFDASADRHQVIAGGARQLDAELRVDMVCHRLEFDEAGAARVEWPKGPWPAEARSTLQLMTFVDLDPRTGQAYDPAPVRQLLDRWTEGRDPRSIRPVQLAKWLAGNVSEHVQHSGRGLIGRSGAFEGFELIGGPATLSEGRGSEFDVPLALAAIYRLAGLPARITIAFDQGAARGRRDPLDRSRGVSALSAWTEFALYDENTDSMAWIPVDIVGIRKAASRLPRNWMDRPLRGFGDMPAGDGILPIAHHFHPPTNARAYAHPAMWGWTATPSTPNEAFQTIRHRGETTPTRGR